MEQTMKEIRTKNPLGYQPIGRLLMKFAIPHDFLHDNFDSFLHT